MTLGEGNVSEKVLRSADSKKMIASLSPYLQDSSSLIRSKSYEITRLAGLDAEELPVREDAVSKLIEGIKDPDAGNAGQVLGYLRAFNTADFNPTCKDTLLNIFKRKSPHYSELIKLIGYLQITKARNDLRALAQSAATPRTERWAALLGLFSDDPVCSSRTRQGTGTSLLPAKAPDDDVDLFRLTDEGLGILTQKGGATCGTEKINVSVDRYFTDPNSETWKYSSLN